MKAMDCSQIVGGNDLIKEDGRVEKVLTDLPGNAELLEASTTCSKIL